MDIKFRRVGVGNAGTPLLGPVVIIGGVALPQTPKAVSSDEYAMRALPHTANSLPIHTTTKTADQ